MHAPAIIDRYPARASERALAAAVLASVLLHAILLFLLPGMRQPSAPTSSSRAVLTATLAPRIAIAPPVLPGPAPVPEPAAATRPPPPKPPPRPPAPAKAPTRLTRPSPDAAASAPPPAPAPPRPLPKAAAPEPKLPASVVPPPVTAAPAPAPPPVAMQAPRQGQAASASASASPAPSPATSPSPSSSPSQGEAPGTPPSPAVDSAQAGLLQQYRLALISAAGLYKRYPAQAMENDWQGKVEVRLEIGTNGLTKRASVKTSSGYPVLDRQALDMVTKGKGRTQVPAALRGREFVIDVPVIFDLRRG